MLLEKRVEPDGDGRGESPSTSNVDIAFGSDQSSFAGCHRFQVKRLERMEHNDKKVACDANEHEPTIEFSIQSFVCNPLDEKSRPNRIMMWFHSVYASLLFADAMREVYGAS